MSLTESKCEIKCFDGINILVDEGIDYFAEELRLIPSDYQSLEH